MKLISWNVNGLRSIFRKDFNKYLQELNPDILCLQEAKSELEQLTEEQIQPLDYQLILNSAKKKGYSGVGNYSKKQLEFKNISYGLGDPLFDQEGRFLIKEFNELKLYNIYFPSGSSGPERQKFKYHFLDYFYDYLSSLKNIDNIIICGDFNICHQAIDIHHPKTAERLELSGFLPEERAWMDRFCKLGFSDSFRLINKDLINYTWWSYRANSRAKNLGWRIDYFFISNNLIPKVKNAAILDSFTGSDHCPILLELDL